MIIKYVPMLIAEKGMILTDGNIYRVAVILPEGRSEDDFDEITKEEYDKILREQEINEEEIYL